MIKKLKSFGIYTIVTLLMLSTVLYTAKPAAAEGNTLSLKGAAHILIDAETGKILYENNADEILGLASMSKMLTEYLVLEAIKEEKISWDQEVRINNFIHRLSSPSLGLSTVGLTEGETYTVKELYETMAIHSANASTVALAELIAGTEANFVQMMREKAAELGLENYHLVNSSGLNNSDMLGGHPDGTAADDENKMTARDTARLAYHLVKDYPEVLDTAKIPVLEFKDGRSYKNFNWMLPGLIKEYNGVDGLKTGSTVFAQYNFTATAERNGQRFISVIMKTSSQEERFDETAKLLDFAFATFKKEEVFPVGLTIEGNESIPVTKGKGDSVGIETNEAINLVINTTEKELYKPKLVLNEELLNENGELTAPVNKGDILGYVTYEYEGKDLGFIDGKELKVDVVATETVEKANWFTLMMRGIGGFFSGLWDSITSTVAGWF